jgi:hypothetical protein
VTIHDFYDCSHPEMRGESEMESEQSRGPWHVVFHPGTLLITAVALLLLGMGLDVVAHVMYDAQAEDNLWYSVLSGLANKLAFTGLMLFASAAYIWARRKP